MATITKDVFKNELLNLLDVLYDKEISNIKDAAKVCSDSIKNGGVVHVFGSGHSIGFGMEMRNRIGSLVPIHQIDMADFVLKGKVTYFEVWNELNLQGADKGKIYAKMLKTAYIRAKEANPDCKIIGPVTAGVNNSFFLNGCVLDIISL